MQEVTTIKRDKADYKELEQYLQKHNLIDDRKIWFGGFDDSTRGQQNAIARNAMYGNRHLMILSIKEEDVYLLRNGKTEFHVHYVGKTTDKYSIKIHRNILYPSIELHCTNDVSIYLQSNKNKKMMKEFKNTLK